MDIVMLHGIWDTGAIFRPMAEHLTRQGHRCHCPDMEPANGAQGLVDLAVKLRAMINTETGPEAPLAVVGFSMGALIARYYLQRLGGANRTSHFFSISGPHHGTRTAHLYPGKAARDMRFDSDFLEALNGDVSAYREIEVHSYRTPFDLLVIPSRSSQLDWATNHTVPALFHHRMVVQPRILKHIAGVLG
jgi:triacylglycerol lipase